VATVSVVVAPGVAVGVIGLAGEKLLALHEGNGVPLPVTAHDSATAEEYPLYAVKATVEVADAPAAMAAGVVAVML
jgi:hypothetical protein